LTLFATWRNLLPANYIVENGDHVFILPNAKISFFKFFFVWGNVTNGAGVPGPDPATILHRGFFYLLGLAGFSNTLKQDINFFLFIFLSGLSAYIAVGLFFKEKVKSITQFVVAIFYAFNGLTILFFSYSGAYLSSHDLHIFLPLIWVLFTKGLIDRKNNYLAWSVLLFFLSVSGFQNPAYMLLLFLFLLSTVAYCFINKVINSSQVWTSFLILFLYLAVIAFYSIHLISFILNPPVELTAGGSVESIEAAKSWLLANARPVISALRFVFYVDNYPDMFPYASLLKPFFVFLSFYPAIFALLALLIRKKDRLWMNFFALMFVVIALLQAKQLLLGNFAYTLFMLPIINVLRSWDKFLVLFPFIYAMLIAFLMIKIQSLKAKKILTGVIILIILIYPLPFFIGKFHVTFERSFLWRYKYNTIVKTPSYYAKMGDYINRDKGYYKNLTMPYGGVIGTGWVLYPKWKFLGADYTTLYLNNPTFSPVEIKYQFKYAKKIQEDKELGQEAFVNLVRLNGIRYLIFNKDVEDVYIAEFDDVFKEVRKNFTFEKNFGNLDIYRLNKEKELPVIYGI
jgi:hypothetical protein